MPELKYASGVEVQIGDLVDLGRGHGPIARVVVIIPSNQAAEGFDLADWSYLKHGVVLQDQALLGLVHINDLCHEQLLVRRA